MEELTLAVVGIDYLNENGSNRRFELLTCAPGDAMRLVLEPTNEHDPLAVAVYSARDHQVGYLSAERCGWIGGRIRAGEDYAAIFQELDTHIASIRIRFGGAAPTLPAPRQKAAAPVRDDWLYRDPDGPEWGA